MGSCGWLRFAWVAFFGLIFLTPTLVQAQAECPFKHTYIGDNPKEGNPGWHTQTQGLAHDGTHWYVTQNWRRTIRSETYPYKESYVPDMELWRIPAERDLGADISKCDHAPGNGLTPVCESFYLTARDVWDKGYDHYGDLDFHQEGGSGYLCVPLEGSGPAALAMFSATTLSLVAWAELPYQDGKASWCAFDADGFVYSSGRRGGDQSDSVFKYKVNWDLLAQRDPVLDLEFQHEVLQFNEAGELLMLPVVQGGTFSEDGSRLYLTNGGNCDECAIHVFEFRSPATGERCESAELGCLAQRIERSYKSFGSFRFRFDNSLPKKEEPEGLTWWDMSGLPGEFGEELTTKKLAIRSAQLHVILLDNDSPDSDDVYVKHYVRGTDCPPAPGIVVTPKPLDFDEVDVGATAAESVRIANTGTADLEVGDVRLRAGSSPAFGLFSTPPLPATIAPAGEVAVEVRFEPESGALVGGTLDVSSNDPASSLVSVPISGLGISLEEQAKQLIEDFDDLVGQDALAGAGTGGSAEHRRKALRNMLVTAADLVAGDFVAEACVQLLDALKRTDDLPNPDDFVSGEGAAILAAEIAELRQHLHCP